MLIEFLYPVAQFGGSWDQRDDAILWRASRDHFAQFETWKTQSSVGQVSDHQNWR